jgi:hypothetical protein
MRTRWVAVTKNNEKPKAKKTLQLNRGDLPIADSKFDTQGFLPSINLAMLFLDTQPIFPRPSYIREKTKGNYAIYVEVGNDDTEEPENVA